MELHGVVTAPPANLPRVQRKLPAKFARPSITVGGGAKAVRRSWKRVLVQDLRVGDVVADVGQIAVIDEVLRIPDRAWDGKSDDFHWEIVLTNVVGARSRFLGETTVMAFTAEG